MGCTLNNCIAYFNSAADPLTANCHGIATAPVFLDYCCTTPLPAQGLGNIEADPRFVDRAAGNLRLAADSPCINAGHNAYAPSPTDADGNPRVVSGTVDIGAYEYPGPGSTISYAWLQQYGLPTDSSADDADADTDGLSAYQEWRCQTDPTDAGSVLRLPSAAPAGTDVLVSWPSVAGVSYFLERSTDLGASPPFTLVATNLLVRTGTNTFTDFNAGALGNVYYRLGVSPP